jgi:hypothetical protein
VDSGPAEDGGLVDALEQPRDGAPPDAAIDDADVAPDAGSDAGPPVCLPSSEVCNLYDDDCDGMTDEGACGCEVRERDGHVYQLCPHASGNDAWGRCTELGPGYDLVIIDDAAEETFIQDWVTFEWVFIGLADFGEDDTWVWADGSTERTDIFLAGEPNGSEDENCVVRTHERARDVDCRSTQRFLCEGARRDAPLPAGAAETCDGRDEDLDGSVDESACECATTVFRHHVYQLCPVRAGWEDARTDCGDAGGYTMIVVSDRGESDFVTEAQPGDNWIGLNDIASENDFVWESDPGEPISTGNVAQGGHFVRWVGAEPNDSGGTHAENCIVAQGGSGSWFDIPCTWENPYVCERAIAPL